MADVVVRRVEAADLDAWVTLFEDVAAEGKWIGAEAPVDRAVRAANFNEFLTSTHKARFVAEVDGLLVGDLGVSDHFGVTELGMMVRAGYRGKGIGSALMAACLDWSRAAGAYKVTLQTWPHNGAAIALYEKFGFAIEGRLRRQWRRRNGELWDALTMGLVLDTESPGSPFADATPAP